MTFPQFLPASRVPEPAEAPPLNWGVIGTGWIARQFIGAVRASTRQQIVAIGSRDQQKAQAFADERGLETAHGSYEALAGDPNVQVVYVATPHSEHAAHALLAIEAGKHVLVEKPFTRNADEARAVVNAARERGVALMEAMWTRFLPRYDIVRQLLADGVLGDLETVIADHGQPIPAEVKRMFDPELAGGALLDLGIYPVSFAAFVLGIPDAVLAVGELTDAGVDRQVAAFLGRFPDHPHAQALVSSTFSAKTPTTASISGSRARIELDAEFYAPGRVRLLGPTGAGITSEAPELAGHHGLAYQAAHFAQLIADGFTESPRMPLDDSVAIIGLLDEIRSQVGVRYPGE
ncbi:MAG TPA: Gfo/Idh/MocA family oxidoreductase [Propionicimonas sp.]|nr:Gfo/Idh/MocA family oxidoreductase [Propionicimonas sp.]HRA05238.1 Gfo/Idh/MocA family oxidoreductase [Propionicimonas sp.]